MNGFTRGVPRRVYLALGLALLAACGGGGLLDGPYIVSGTVTAAPGSIVDSDVNDPHGRYVSNDELVLAQPLRQGTVVGGFGSARGSGRPDGRFAHHGDRSDYYRLEVVPGQRIHLHIGDPHADLDLLLKDEFRRILAVSVNDQLAGAPPTETLEVPGYVAAGTVLYVKVKAFHGASNYSLAVAVEDTADAPAAGDVGGNSGRVAQPAADEFVPGQWIVRFKPPVRSAGAADGVVALRHAQRVQSWIQARGLTVLGGAPGRDMLVAWGPAGRRLDLAPAGDRFADPRERARYETLMALKVWRRQDDVESARLNRILRANAVPDDPLYPGQWHYPLINLPQAWDLAADGAGVVVAVIDSGILPDHPDLLGQQVAGYDFVSDVHAAGDGDGLDPDPTDEGGGPGRPSDYHGTHVAGTVAAASNNALGVAGVAWRARIMPLRVLDGDGAGTLFDVEQAVLYAAGQPNDSGFVPARPADVINLSLGAPAHLVPETSDAFRRARAAGVIVVASAGNNGGSWPSLPAAFDGVVAVGATDLNGQRAFYSSFGIALDLVAPGGDASVDLDQDGAPDGVLSTSGEATSDGVRYGYKRLEGTSMAAPHVAGVAALMKSVNPDLTPALFDALLAHGALTQDAGAPGRDDEYGHGLVDAAKAVQAARTALTDPPPPRPILAVSPGRLRFGGYHTSLLLEVRNVGAGALPIEAVSVEGTDWLDVQAFQVDASGHGYYTVTVDRGTLPPQGYEGAVHVRTAAAVRTVPVSMQVYPPLPVADVGRQHVLLVRMDGAPRVVQRQAVEFDVHGRAEFLFVGVAAGDYLVVAGSDMNYDGRYCQRREACGVFPALDGGGLSSLQVYGHRFGLELVSAYRDGLPLISEVISD